MKRDCPDRPGDKCSYCKKNGHNDRNCPDLKCYKCHGRHRKSNCPNTAGPAFKCFRCGGNHHKRDCTTEEGTNSNVACNTSQTSPPKNYATGKKATIYTKSKNKSEPIKVGNSLIFLGKEMILSNWYPCSFTIGNRTFNCVEQYLGYHMAMSAGDKAVETEIMNTVNPRTQMNLFETIKWSNMSRSEYDMSGPMYDSHLAKFQQNKSLADYLIGTGDVHLLEGTRSLTWGMGLSLNRDYASGKIMDKSKWPRKAANKCGKSLEKVRSNLSQFM